MPWKITTGNFLSVVADKEASDEAEAGTSQTDPGSATGDKSSEAGIQLLHLQIIPHYWISVNCIFWIKEYDLMICDSIYLFTLNSLAFMHIH